MSVYDKKVIDYINFILRAGEIADCPIEKVGGEILCGSKSIRLTVPVYEPVSLYVCLAAWNPANLSSLLWSCLGRVLSASAGMENDTCFVTDAA